MSEPLTLNSAVKNGAVRVAGDIHMVLGVMSAMQKRSVQKIVDEILRPALVADAVKLNLPLMEVQA